jgi:dTDP-4-dehydrorhamnose reductase
MRSGMAQGFERLLITGANGMLGSHLVENLKREGFGESVFPFSKEELDITDGDSLKKVLYEIKPDVVVNCAAFTDVDACEDEYKKAFKVNGLGPRLLARFSNELNFKLVHISTDYIFDGKKKEPYKEDDIPNPVNLYGRSKLEGEKGVQNSKNYLIIRTAWLFGKGKNNFVSFIFEKLKTSGEIRVIKGQTGSPTYADDLSRAIIELIKRGVNGIINVVNDGFCSRYELARKVMSLMKTDAVIYEIPQEEMRRPARRPLFTPLSLDKLKSLGINMRRWELAVESYVEELKKESER